MSNMLALLIAALVGLFSLLIVVGMAVLIVRSVKKAGGMEGIAATLAQKLAEHPSRSYNVRAPVPRTATMPIIAAALIGVDLVIMGVTGAIQWGLIQEARLLVEEGRQTGAVVIDRSISEDDDGDETFYLWYQFETIDGDQQQTIKRKEKVSESLYLQAEPGTIVDVIYAPSRPQTARLMAQYIPGKVRYLPLWIGGSFSASFLLSALYFRRQQERGAQLDAEGAVAVVPLLDKYVDQDSEGTTYYVAYQVPGGEPVRHSVTKRAYEQLQVGQPVQVRYLPENPNTFRLES